MSRSEVLKIIKGVIIDYFDDDELIIEEKTIANDIDGWDSLAQISILAAMEGEFNIRFSINDTVRMKNIGDMVDIVLSLLKSK